MMDFVPIKAPTGPYRASTTLNGTKFVTPQIVVNSFIGGNYENKPACED
jgi:hypothetical protein